MPKALRSNQMPSLQMRRTLRQAHEKLLQKSKENSTTTPEKIFEKNPKMISGKKKTPRSLVFSRGTPEKQKKYYKTSKRNLESFFQDLSWIPRVSRNRIILQYFIQDFLRSFSRDFTRSSFQNLSEFQSFFSRITSENP